VSVAAVRATGTVVARPLTPTVAGIVATATRAALTAVARPVVPTGGAVTMQAATLVLAATARPVAVDAVNWTVEQVGRPKVLPE
jgi:hypothetical protein